ncbi:MAG: hypothetical protein GY756_12860 [bacterium]|nr:hypothetical protein [bacterium]
MKSDQKQDITVKTPSSTNKGIITHIGAIISFNNFIFFILIFCFLSIPFLLFCLLIIGGNHYVIFLLGIPMLFMEIFLFYIIFIHKKVNIVIPKSYRILQAYGKINTKMIREFYNRSATHLRHTLNGKRLELPFYYGGSTLDYLNKNRCRYELIKINDFFIHPQNYYLKFFGKKITLFKDSQKAESCFIIKKINNFNIMESLSELKIEKAFYDRKFYWALIATIPSLCYGLAFSQLNTIETFQLALFSLSMLVVLYFLILLFRKILLRLKIIRFVRTELKRNSN